MNWEFGISPGLQSIITSPVREQGMQWWRNGQSQPRNAPHVEAAGYLFCGTLKPVHVHNEVINHDEFDFKVQVGDQTGDGELLINGHVRAVRR